MPIAIQSNPIQSNPIQSNRFDAFADGIVLRLLFRVPPSKR
jgi:hypothetical protein